jgi:hypothetical protein
VHTHSSRYWIEHFTRNAGIRRVNWDLVPAITAAEKRRIVRSLKAWQLGETSDGAHLLLAATRYAEAVGDAEYPDAVRLFIAEEQKHGRYLGRYLDLIGEPRLTRNWGDTLFRRVRYHNASMELWTLAVITVESAAQVFYRAMRDATSCALLREICTDILVDEVAHIVFQKERLHIIFQHKTPSAKRLSCHVYSIFFDCVGLVVWVAHRRLFRAGGVPLVPYLRKMRAKRRHVIGRAVLFGVADRRPSRAGESTSHAVVREPAERLRRPAPSRGE